MILADKIIMLRKKNGLTQEEFAEKMNVSRQAISKWESGQSIPDLDKILKISTLFGMTTDYLLKDEIVCEENTNNLSEKKQEREHIASAVFVTYFGIIALIYFIWSFISKDWHTTLLIFIAGGIFVPLISALCNKYVNKYE